MKEERTACPRTRAGARELYAHQIDLEKQELESAPEGESNELALIYEAKGLPPDRAQELAPRADARQHNRTERASASRSE